MSDALGYAGRRVVVSGAASGIGRATAQLLADLGAEVHAVDIAPIDLPGLASVTECDVRDPLQIEATAERIGSVVNGLFCCAGVPMGGDPVEIMTVNFVGMRETADRFAALMTDGAAIASMGSVAGIGWHSSVDWLEPLLEISDFEEAREWCVRNRDKIEPDPYGVSKQAVNLWTRRRALEHVSRGIRVNCVNAGPVETPLLAPFAEAYGDALMEMFPIGRYARAEEVAHALIWLNSSWSSYVTGVGLAVDGGFAAATGNP